MRVKRFLSHYRWHPYARRTLSHFAQYYLRKQFSRDSLSNVTGFFSTVVIHLQGLRINLFIYWFRVIYCVVREAHTLRLELPRQTPVGAYPEETTRFPAERMFMISCINKTVWIIFIALPSLSPLPLEQSSLPRLEDKSLARLGNASSSLARWQLQAESNDIWLSVLYWHINR